MHAAAIGAELQAMIGALQAVGFAIAADDLAHRQGGEAVRTAVLERDRLAVGLAEEHDGLFQDHAGDNLAGLKLLRPGRAIPGIAHERAADHGLVDRGMAGARGVGAVHGISPFSGALRLPFGEPAAERVPEA